MAQDGLRDPQGNNDQRKDHVDKEKSTQVSLGIEQGISDKEQRNIVEKELQSQNAVDNGRGRRIKDLHHAKPGKNNNRNEEGRPEGRDLLAAVGQEKGEIDESS